MAFSHTDYVFSHTMKNQTDANQPAVFTVDLADLIQLAGHSALFTIDSMTVTAYSQGDWKKVPVKFAVLNGNKTRVITYDPNRHSSKWLVDLGAQEASGVNKDHSDGRRCVKIAGTDREPFSRALSVYEDENKQAALNVLRFMMSESLWVADKARGALDILMASAANEFNVHCDLCGRRSVVYTQNDSGSSFAFPECEDTYVCMPSARNVQDRTYRALCDIMTLIRCACADNLSILTELTRSDCGLPDGPFSTDFPPRDRYQGRIVIPHSLMKYLTALYEALSDYADSFAIVDSVTPNVKVLLESPCPNIGLVSGSIGVTTIYGSTVCEVYNGLLTQHQSADVTEDEAQHYGLVNGAPLIPQLLPQLIPQVLLRRAPLTFDMRGDMDLHTWKTFFYRRPSALYRQ